MLSGLLRKKKSAALFHGVYNIALLTRSANYKICILNACGSICIYIYMYIVRTCRHFGETGEGSLETLIPDAWNPEY